jgi:hypothetical protein
MMGGHCQFASIAAAVYGDEGRHRDTRREICDYLAGPGYRFIEEILTDGILRVDHKSDASREHLIDPHEWLQVMRDDGTMRGDIWGNAITLNAAIRLYRLRIYLLKPDQPVIVEYAPEWDHTIMLLLTGPIAAGHYELLGRDRSDGKGAAGGVPRRSPGAGR